MADGSMAGSEPRKPNQPLTDGVDPAQAKEVAGAAGGKKANAKADDPLLTLIDRMDRLQPMIARFDNGLAASIRGIAQQADSPGRIGDPMFRTRVAYALQDVEKAHGSMRSVQPALREELTRLAVTTPGLHNERMQALMQTTATINDRILVRDIRRSASEIARDRDQTSPDAQSRIDVLENRARLDPRVTVGLDAARTETSRPATPAGEQAGMRNSPSRDSSHQTAENVLDEGKHQPATRQPEQVNPFIQNIRPDQVQQAGKLGATFAIMNALRRPEPDTPAPWDQQLTPLKSRIERWKENDKNNSEEASLRAAERSGHLAMQALRSFANAPESNVMAKIKEAAKSDPDGEAGVVAGMREGGPYQDLRRTFNADLVRERGFAAALDRVTAAVNKYGADRTAADTIAASRADAATINARFEKLDAEVFKGASSTPSRSDGKSQMEELCDRAAELAKKAVEAFKAVFSRKPGAGHSDPSPSP